MSKFKLREYVLIKTAHFKMTLETNKDETMSRVWTLTRPFSLSPFHLEKAGTSLPPLTDSLFPTRSCQTKYFMRVSHTETRDMKQLRNAKQPKRKEKLTEYLFYMR